ncbi:MFS transporter [Klebsiella sp. BIGb0407]|uniref:MFS transporter n=1 Tax=Klebsiella sp. BIGb0407 TaxID=2940603 RepID=UPI002167E4C7|nr:MFS transporter [Klebsiella sp. BIGb0407]MCS3431693.1 putative MFS transporter [Klebsiella sp. BIGb0407]
MTQLVPETTTQHHNSSMGQLETALDNIGTTRSHRMIILMVVIGVMFDVFEQNAIGLIAPLLQMSWGLTATDIGFLNTITFISAASGRLLSGYFADRFGRRFMLNVNLLLFTLGAILCALAPNYATLAIGRLIVGFGLGGEITTAVTLLAEFCSSRFRGTAVGIINVGGGGLGNMLAPAFALLVFYLFPGENSWRWLFACLVLPALLLILYRRFIPETPRYLVSQGEIQQANHVLSMLAAGKLLHQTFPVSQYIDEKPVTDRADTQRVGSWRMIFSGSYRKTTISMGIASWMTFGAQLALLTLMPTILVSQGYSINKSFLFTIIMQSGSLLGALTASYLAFYFPRKVILTCGSIAACASAIAFGSFTDSVATILLTGALFQFCVLLLNTTVWVYAPELFPTKMRGFGTSFILAMGTIGGALMQIPAGKMFDLMGTTGLFAMIAGMYIIFLIAIQFSSETFKRSIDRAA